MSDWDDRPGWTTIPPWLYQNDLPDDELQRLYVAAAERKLAALLAEVPPRLQQIASMRAFLAEARAALVSYRAPPPVVIERNPRCPHCGKLLGEYFGLPWSIRCANCRRQARRALPSS